MNYSLSILKFLKMLYLDFRLVAKIAKLYFFLTYLACLIVVGLFYPETSKQLSLYLSAHVFVATPITEKKD